MHLLPAPAHGGACVSLTVLAVLAAMALAFAPACDDDDGPKGIEQCTECASDMICPAVQPGLNPLELCETRDAECFYCGDVRRRFVCRGVDDTDDDLRWRDNGEPEMCPAPSDDTTAGTG